MNPLLLIVLIIIGYIAAYRLYGRFLGSKVFRLSLKNQVPSHEFEDGVDFVPARKEVIFGHHYTSIAGTGPIVGPAIAIIWGWLPAVIWIFLGSIFMGAVHDFGSLVVSMRNQGLSISEITDRYISRTSRIFFFIIAFIELWIFIAVLSLVIAIIFNLYPESVIPVWFEIPIAMVLGYMVYKRSMNITIWSVIALILMYATMIVGVYFPLEISGTASIPSTGIWAVILLIYAFVASVIPVQKLLQPRDYINSHELFVAMFLIIAGTIAASVSGNLQMFAPAVNHNVKDAPAFFPFLFITIACGAISGFHSLVSSGTTSRQIDNEKDALWVGYGSMLMEGLLAILVIVAAGAGIGMGYKDPSGVLHQGFSAWQTHYASWSAASGLAAKLNAFVVGSANLIASLGIPGKWALALMGVFVASFAGTSLDSATRIQRYIIGEFLVSSKISRKSNRFLTTFIAVFTAGILVFATGASGKGALTLWPLFGAVNQTLAALALVVITIYLKRRRGKLYWLITAIPAVFMIIITNWATISNEISFIHANNILLSIVNGFIILLVNAIAVEGVIAFFKKEN